MLLWFFDLWNQGNSYTRLLGDTEVSSCRRQLSWIGRGGKWRFLASATRKMDVWSWWAQFSKVITSWTFSQPSLKGCRMLLHLPHFDVEEACFRKNLLVECWQVLRVRHFFETAGQVMWQVASDHAWCKGLALCMIVTQCFALTWRFCQRYHWPHKESVFLKKVNSDMAVIFRPRAGELAVLGQI